MPRRRSPRRSLRRTIPPAFTLTLAVLAGLAAGSGQAWALDPTPSTRSAEAVPATGEGARVATTTPTVAVAAVDPAIPRPAAPKNLPVAIEQPSGYLKQISCDPVAKSGAVALGKLLVSTYPGTSYGVARACGADGIASEHYEGRAVDWMVSGRQGQADAAAFLEWLLAPDAAGNPFANARRLGVMYVIWDDHIWGSYANAAGWRAYSVCANHPEAGWNTSCHRDHVHLSLSWSGAMGATSFWTGKVAPTDYGPCRPADLNWAAPRTASNASPCPSYPVVTAPAGSVAPVPALFQYSGAVVGQGSTGPVVRALQAGLGVGADGRFGPATAAAVAAFRRAQGLPGSGSVDAPMWRALLKGAVSVPPVASGDTTAHPTTPPTSPKPAPKPAPKPGAPATSPLTRYKSLVLTPGSRGEAVCAVQRALKVSPVSGWFGPATKAAVIAFQKAHGIPATGNVGPLTWKALGA